MRKLELTNKLATFFYGPKVKGEVVMTRLDRNTRRHWHILVKTADKDNQFQSIVYPSITSAGKPYEIGDQFEERVKRGGMRGFIPLPIPLSKMERNPFNLDR